MFKASNFTHTVTVSYLSRFFQVYISLKFSLLFMFLKSKRKLKKLNQVFRCVREQAEATTNHVALTHTRARVHAELNLNKMCSSNEGDRNFNREKLASSLFFSLFFARTGQH